MTDPQRGYAGWPAPSNLTRPNWTNGNYRPGAAPNEEPPWLSETFVPYDEPGAPWDRPADVIWPESESESDSEFDGWYDEPARAEPLRPARWRQPASPQTATPRWGSAPAYPQPSEAPYAAPSHPPYERTAAPYAAPVPRPNTTSTRYAAAAQDADEPPLPQSPAPTPRTPAPVSAWYENVVGPYDEYAPLADDLAMAGENDDLDWPEPSRPPAPASTPRAAVPAAAMSASAPAPSAAPRPVIGSVFGDMFSDSPSGRPAPDRPVPAAPPAASVELDPDQPAAIEAAPADADWPPIDFAARPRESVRPVAAPWSTQPPNESRARRMPATPGGTPRLPAVQPLNPAAHETPPAQPAQPTTVASAQVQAPATLSPMADDPASGSDAQAAVSADPTRASLASQSAQAHEIRDDLWFVAEPGKDAAVDSDDDANDEDKFSTISTIFWTVMTGLLVVGLVLAFLHFVTGVFR